jgi:DNA-binding NarL/FixJ family response regulator
VRGRSFGGAHLPGWGWCSSSARPVAAISLSTLTAREREMLAVMAEVRSNAAIAKELVISEGAVEKHMANIFTKLDLPVSEDDHRRVLAVLRFLES